MKKIDFSLLGPQFADSRQWYDDMTSSSNVDNDNGRVGAMRRDGGVRVEVLLLSGKASYYFSLSYWCMVRRCFDLSDDFNKQ